MSPDSLAALAVGVRSGERRATARAITLVESSRPGDGPLAEALLEQLLPHTGAALRLGVSGAPGAGKSSLIDVLGRHAIAAGKRVGVLAIDPSSSVSGGSLLGDRTRMLHLVTDDRAFVRPSPSSGATGGLAPRTREALLVLEAAGYDLLIVETVGIGQGELAVSEVVDELLVLLVAGAGDEVQGMKRGIIEHADFVVFGKADGLQLLPTLAARDELAALFAWMRRDRAEVVALSAWEDREVRELWQRIEQRFSEIQASGALALRRRAQRKHWLHAELDRALLERARSNPRLGSDRDEWLARVERGEVLPSVAARHLATFF